MNDRYCNIQFTGNFEDSPDIRVYVPRGVTERQLEKWQNEYEKIQTEHGKNNNEDYSEFNVKGAIETAADKLNIEYKYPKVDYTVYI